MADTHTNLPERVDSGLDDPDYSDHFGQFFSGSHGSMGQAMDDPGVQIESYKYYW